MNNIKKHSVFGRTIYTTWWERVSTETKGDMRIIKEQKKISLRCFGWIAEFVVNRRATIKWDITHDMSKIKNVGKCAVASRVDNGEECIFIPFG